MLEAELRQGQTCIKHWCYLMLFPFGTKTYHYVTVPTGLMLDELQTHIISKNLKTYVH